MNPIERYQALLANKKSDRKVLQNAIYDILSAYAQGDIKALPKDIAQHMANSIRELYLEANQSKVNRKPFSKKKSATDIECIKDGVKYIQWVKAGLISDKSYNRTVREAFNVNSSTVRSWVSNENYQTKLPNAKKITNKDRQSVIKMITFSGNYYSRNQ